MLLKVVAVVKCGRPLLSVSCDPSLRANSRGSACFALFRGGAISLFLYKLQGVQNTHYDDWLDKNYRT